MSCSWGSHVPRRSGKWSPRYFYLFRYGAVWGFSLLLLRWDKKYQESSIPPHTILLTAEETVFSFRLPNRSSPLFSAVPRVFPLAHSTFVLQEELPLTWMWICIPHTRRVRSGQSSPLRHSLGSRTALQITPCILIAEGKWKSPFFEMARINNRIKGSSGNEVKI